MEGGLKLHLAGIERRCRLLTGAILAVMAFVAAYGIMLVEGQTTRPAFHIYPWLLAALFYLGGDLLALIWCKTLAWQLGAFLRAQYQLDDADAAATTTASRAPSVAGEEQ